MKNPTNWNIGKIGAKHIGKVERAKNYLNELRVRIQKGDPRADMSKFEFDRTLARYTLYNHLCDRRYFASKDALKAELESLQVNPISPIQTPYAQEGYFSSFSRECQSYLSDLNKDES